MLMLYLMVLAKMVKLPGSKGPETVIGEAQVEPGDRQLYNSAKTAALCFGSALEWCPLAFCCGLRRVAH